MKSTEEILRVLGEARPDLSSRFGVRRLAVYGSYARGDQREDSDVDVLVEVDQYTGPEFAQLAETIQSLLGVPTKVVCRTAMKPRRWEAIRRELVDVP